MCLYVNRSSGSKQSRTVCSTSWSWATGGYVPLKLIFKIRSFERPVEFLMLNIFYWPKKVQMSRGFIYFDISAK